MRHLALFSLWVTRIALRGIEIGITTITPPDVNAPSDTLADDCPVYSLDDIDHTLNQLWAQHQP